MKRYNRRSQSRLEAFLAAEVFEARQMLSAVTASIDGTGNNVDNPELGSTGVELLRLSDAEYADGVSSPAGDDRVSARVVSNNVAAQSESILNDRNLTDYIWIWGQFLDHDIDLTESAEPHEEFNIEVPFGDPLFDPFFTGEAEIGLNRSIYVDGDESSDGIRNQINEITAFIDGSVVYGSDQERADALRTFEGGLLKTSGDGEYLPYNVDGLANAGGTSDSLYLAGDIRANENIALTSMHTIFVREHNRIATELAAEDPSLTDEELYQQARSIVRAQLQVITYNEFLPALLGADALSEYSGYDPSVNPNIANEFSTAAYRFGHSLLSPELQLLDENGEVIDGGNVSLSEAFFRPDQVEAIGVDAILRGASTQLAQELDSHVVDDVRNFLFGPPGAGGLDLVSLNVQRGRDHGLADYNQVRADLGLEPVTSFDQITSNPELALALEETYGSVDNIDLWVGGLAEDHVEGSSMGETFSTIIIDQFERLRDGDRFWYQNVMDGEELAEVESTTLSDIIERNTGIEGLQTNLFFQHGTEVLDVNAEREGTDNVAVRVENDRVTVVDADSGRVLAERPADEVAGINLRGADGRSERFTIAADGIIPMNVSVDGGSRGRDTLVVRGTSSDDVITVDEDSIEMAALDVVFQNIETIILEGDDGDDVLDATSASVDRTILMGGRGDDLLLGSEGRDRMFGQEGRDTLKGRGGDDTMSGGEDEDLMYGGRGRDGMNGGRGNDMLLQDGDGRRSDEIARLAAYMGDSLSIRRTGSNFANWGGRGEHWLMSDEGWLFITPEGALHRWDGSGGANGELIAQLNAQVFNNQDLLTQPGGRLDDDNPDALNVIVEDLNIRVPGNLFENWAGLGERWLWSSGQWLFITPDGMLYEYDTNATGIPGNAVAELTPETFRNPDRFFRNRR
ncbi:MAG: peroxidase [Planctomycetaceae bacterium]|nr:peroxidase [Planctomycetaceae bacterium]